MTWVNSLDPPPPARGKTQSEIDADTIKSQVQEWHYRVARGETPPPGALEALVARQREAEAVVDAERTAELVRRKGSRP